MRSGVRAGAETEGCESGGSIQWDRGIRGRKLDCGYGGSADGGGGEGMRVCNGPFRLFVVGRLGWVGWNSVFGYLVGSFGRTGSSWRIRSNDLGACWILYLDGV